MGTAAGANMEYRILGPFEVLDELRPIDLTAARPRTLLACLLLHRGGVVAVDVLMDAVWDARPPRSAPNLVQVYVSQLRRVLPAGAIETRPPGYVLHARREDVDADRFEDLLAQGRDALDANPRLARSLLRRALDLWRGPALADFAYAEFAVAEAARLEELRLVCVEERLAADLALGQHQVVLAELTALVAEQPHRQRLRAHLMLALYRAGRHAEALEVYRDARRALLDLLGLDPAPELRALERAILRQDAALELPDVPPVTLPRPPAAATLLVGRERELEALATLVARRDVRLVTLAGAGGSGKTRLALAFAEEAGRLFANGAAVVELATLHEAELIVPTVADALGVAESPGAPLVRTLGEWLAPQELLLVLDNLEQLPGCEEAISRLLAAAPRVTVIATSRRVLHISGEHVFPVQPLPEDDAFTLFVERARARDAAFAPARPEDAEAVREICRRLDGLPLAIELAAARTNTLAPQELLERLVPRLTLLTGGPRDLPARQQTLRDTLVWSTDLLTPAEQDGFACLGVFEGGFTLEAAELVAATDVDCVGTLVDHHLLQRIETEDGTRFSMLETVREHALERLETQADAPVATERHATYYLSLAEQRRREVVERGLLTPLASLEPDYANLRAALAHLREAESTSSELRLCAALWQFWWLSGRIAEGRRRLTDVLERSAGLESVSRASVLRGAAILAHRQGEYAAAAALAEHAAALARALGERTVLAGALMAQGNAVSSLGDSEGAALLYELSAEAYRGTGADWEFATLLMNMGDLALSRGDLDTAERHASESLALFRRFGDDSGIAANLGNLAFAALDRGEPDRAFELLAEALRRSHQLGFGEWIAMMLGGLAAVAVARGSPARAACLVGAAARLREELGVSVDSVEERVHTRTSSLLREYLDDETLANALAEGRALSTDEAVAVALTSEPPTAG